MEFELEIKEYITRQYAAHGPDIPIVVVSDLYDKRDQSIPIQTFYTMVANQAKTIVKEPFIVIRTTEGQFRLATIYFVHNAALK